MIIVTDGVEKIKLMIKDISFYDKLFKGYKIIPKFTYFLVEIIIVVEHDCLKEIIKLSGGGEEILERFVNKVKSTDTIVLSSKDFEKFKRLYNNMRRKKDFRKYAIINAYAEILSYEYFQAHVLEDLPNITMEDLFCDLNESYNYWDYRDEILKKAREIHRKKYKID